MFRVTHFSHSPLFTLSDSNFQSRNKILRFYFSWIEFWISTFGSNSIFKKWCCIAFLTIINVFLVFSYFFSSFNQRILLKLFNKLTSIISNSFFSYLQLYLIVYYSIIKFNINIVCTYSIKSGNQKPPISPTGNQKPLIFPDFPN